MSDLGKRYSRNLMGINASGAVSVTHAAAKPATEGHTAFEMTTPAGVVSYVTGTALVAVNSYRLLQLQDGEVRASQAFKGSDVLAVTNQDYVAPAVQLDNIAIDDTIITATLAIGGLKEFSIAARDTTPGNQPFPVTEGRVAIRNTTTTKIQLITQLVNAFNGVPDLQGNSDEGFAGAVIVGTATGKTVTTGVASAIGDKSIAYASSTLVSGDLVNVAGFLYTVTSKSATSCTINPAIAKVGTAAAGGAVAATATAIAISGATDDTHFSTIATEDLEDAATVTTTTPWLQGTGDPASVAAMEEEFMVFAGNTTINTAWEDDFGKATRFTSASETYGLSIIKYKKGTASMAYANEQANHVGYIILANDGGSAIVVA